MSKSPHHSVDVELASEYGIEEAILIHHFQHWVGVNKRLKRNEHEGRTWTYQTFEEIAAHFSYWSPDKIRDIIARLTEGRSRRAKNKDQKEFESVLITGNFNKSKFDRTTWYAFRDQEKFTKWANAQMESGECPNPFGEMPKPIPDTIPDTKTNLPPPTSSVKATAAEFSIRKDGGGVFGCLKELGIAQEQKERLSRVFSDEARMERAVKRATMPGFVPEDLVAVIVANYKSDAPAIVPKAERSGCNKQIAKTVEQIIAPKLEMYPNVSATALNSCFEFASGQTVIALDYESIDFKKKLREFLNKRNLLTKEIEDLLS